MSFKKEAADIKIKFGNLIKTESDLINAVNIANILKCAYGEISDDLFNESLNKCKKLNPKNANDYFYLILKSLIKKNNNPKLAYPMNGGTLFETVEPEFDIDKWADLVHKIYDAVAVGDMNFDNALDYYSGNLNSKDGEDINFKRWVKYYKDGEYLKYSAIEDVDMKKESVYQFPLMGGGTYPLENKPVIMQEKHRFDAAREKSQEKQNFEDWKAKLYGAIRRIDKLLRQSDNFIEGESHRDLADLLHSFDMEVRNIKLHNTAADLAFKAARRFKKLGFDEGHSILTKFAQEAPPITENIEPEEISPEEFSPDDISQKPEPKLDIQTDGEEDSRLLGRGTSERPDYKALAGDITIEVATSKLEEVAGALSDRRVIRLLAEFDIMLDKIGIAPMFPELAESQSKLIDSYSYALTRVTKMLGMLSSGRSFAEIAGAKGQELNNSVQKEVNKTFQSGNAPEAQGQPGDPAAPKGQEAIQNEFGPKDEPAPTGPIGEAQAPKPEPQIG